ncbi:MAG: ABC transporter ATP-binding protein [Eubacteriales bacterium]
MKKLSLANNRIRFLHTLLIGSRRTLLLAILCSMLYNVCHSMIPQVVRVVIDNVLEQGNLNLTTIALTIVILALTSSIFDFLSRSTIARSSESFIENLRNRLFTHISKLPYDWHIKHQTGDIIQRCTSDSDVIRKFIAVQLIEVFKVSFLILVSVCIMWSMNPSLTMISIVFIPIVILYSALFFKHIAKRFLEADELEGELSSVVQENLTGVRVVRAFGRESYELERFDRSNHAFANAWIRMGVLNGYYWGFGDFFTSLQILIIVVLGVVYAVNGMITSGEFVAFVSYNVALVWPLRTLGRVLVDMSKAFVSIDRISYILDAKVECDPPTTYKPPMSQDIVFDHVSYAYEEGRTVLKDLNFTIPANSTFAILGGTGSGKSTLMHLLNRLYELPEECGTIRIGKTDLRHIPLDYLRRHVGIVLQEPFLFSKSIGENISITHPDCSVEDIEEVSKIASIHQSICGFTHQYDTIVGERGVTLSGGQKQRVAIARMLLQKAPIMIFDDSLSAVDNETDIKIRSALEHQLNDTTVILISHRITTVMEADTILVLENGKIAQLGSHAQLVSESGIYQEIYEMQMNMEDLEGGTHHGLY